MMGSFDSVARGLIAALRAKLANYFLDATNTTAIRNSTASQTFYVYDTYIDASNYRRLKFSFTTGDAVITMESAGTGTAGLGNLLIMAASGKELRMGGNATDNWDITTAGHLTPHASASYDLGLSTVLVRNAYFASWQKTAPKTVASLVAAATAGAGARDVVNDANATTYAAIVAGGGANTIPVYSDGTNWRTG